MFSKSDAPMTAQPPTFEGVILETRKNMQLLHGHDYRNFGDYDKLEDAVKLAMPREWHGIVGVLATVSDPQIYRMPSRHGAQGADMNDNLFYMAIAIVRSEIMERSDTSACTTSRELARVVGRDFKAPGSYNDPDSDDYDAARDERDSAAWERFVEDQERNGVEPMVAGELARWAA